MIFENFKYKQYYTIQKYVFYILVLMGLYLSRNYSYLLFHVLIELFSIIVASTLSIITWNSRQYIKNSFFLIIGIAYLFIGFIDLLHTLSYVGMNIFPDDRYYANQLWIGGRYLESLTLLYGLLRFTGVKKNLEYRIFTIYLVLTAVLVHTIFVSGVFPVCYVAGTGQTGFKIISEYIIITILGASLFMLAKRKPLMDGRVFLYIVLSVSLTILSEFAFTQYVSNYGVFNIIGHYLKLFSFFFIYKSIIETGITKPLNLIFKEVDELNTRLNRELELKTKKEEENTKLIWELQGALAEVKTLGDLLPVCMHCKNVRDDKGYWGRIEEYLSSKTGTSISHGICPDCLEKYYPELKAEMDKEKEEE